MNDEPQPFLPELLLHLQDPRQRIDCAFLRRSDSCDDRVHRRAGVYMLLQYPAQGRDVDARVVVDGEVDEVVRAYPSESGAFRPGVVIRAGDEEGGFVDGCGWFIAVGGSAGGGGGGTEDGRHPG